MIPIMKFDDWWTEKMEGRTKSSKSLARQAWKAALAAAIAQAEPDEGFVSTTEDDYLVTEVDVLQAMRGDRD